MAEPARESPRRDDTPAEAPSVALHSIEFRSDHGLLKDCKGEHGWRNAGSPCPQPEWTPKGAAPISVSMRKRLVIRLKLEARGGGPTALTGAIRGVGPAGITFESRSLAPGAAPLELSSARRLRRRIRKLQLALNWSVGGARVSPAKTSNVVYVTMGQPQTDKERVWQEDGVTLKRMDRAVAWVGPLNTLDPHAIVGALLARFPTYTLQPSPKVPRQFHHPTYLNNEGGAWAMSDYPEETGECQAIVRLIRGMLRQLGIPGKTRVIVVWGDPNVGGGREAQSADLEEQPWAGLDVAKVEGGRTWRAALVDGPVEEGKTYPASHTRMADGTLSPGLNRYEACLEFTHGGVTRYYAGGAGVFDDVKPILGVFWGLIWFSSTENDGYRVEKIVARYGAAGGGR
ncbi:hypothetical protein SOCE26_016130 [Sorangium cellulosum]|uniref:Uncharacterized protein n=1 Tax=Sorangium cellulosum TaxID=56 RepID=A0A2L0ELN8_SORCE|nr:hypothetical protein [Sorangium cellulosum]AUX40214.1 hypothetical protein SOCE26_016130 [Sorangium cellulosum]